jgi:Ca-activated chloride channel homolog
VQRVLPMIGDFDPGPNEAGSYSLYLGDFEPYDPPALLLELSLPPWGTGAYRAAQTLLTCDAPDPTQARLTIREDIIFEMSPEGEERHNARVARIVDKVNAFQLGTLALQEAEQGDRGAATIRLRQAATRLLGMGESELGNQMLKQAQLLEHDGKLDRHATKKLRYDTRKITQKLEDTGQESRPE